MDPVDGDIIVSDASHWAFANTGLINGGGAARLQGRRPVENGPEGLRGTRYLAKNLNDPSKIVVANMTAYVARRELKSLRRERPMELGAG